MPSSILYEDEHMIVVHRPAAGEPTLITFADLTFRPNGHMIWGQDPVTKLGVNAIGFVAKQENWYPAVSVQAAAAAVRAAIHGPAITYGFSMGAYAALKYATLLGAQRALAVAAQDSIVPSEVPGDTRFHKFYRAGVNTDMPIERGESGDFAILLADPYMPEDLRQSRRIQGRTDVHWVRTPFMDHYPIWLLTGGNFLPQVLPLIMAGDLPGFTKAMRLRRHTSPHWFMHVGLAAFRRRHVALANRLWQRSVALGMPTDIAAQEMVRALRQRVDQLLRHDKRDKASHLALQQAEAWRDNFLMQAQIGHVLLGMQRPEEAEGPFRRALALRQDVGNIYQGLSLILGGRGQMKEAVVLCRRGVEAVPEDLGLQVHLGHLLVNSGKVEDAEDVFRTLLDRDPNNSKALLGLSNSLAARGEREEAILVARRLIAEPDADVQSYLWLGQLLLFVGEPEEAEPVFRTAVMMNDKLAAAPIGLARALERSGRMEEARYVATRAAEDLPHEAKLQALALRLGPPADPLLFDDAARPVQQRSRLRNLLGTIFNR